MKFAIAKPRPDLADKIEASCASAYKPKTSDYVRFRNFLRALRGRPIDITEARLIAKSLPRHEWSEELDTLMLPLGWDGDYHNHKWSADYVVYNSIKLDTDEILAEWEAEKAAHAAKCQAMRAQLTKVIRDGNNLPLTLKIDFWRHAMAYAENAMDQIKE